jgi:hypothetical protein
LLGERLLIGLSWVDSLVGSTHVSVRGVVCVRGEGNVVVRERQGAVEVIAQGWAISGARGGGGDVRGGG